MSYSNIIYFKFSSAFSYASYIHLDNYYGLNIITKDYN